MCICLQSEEQLGFKSSSQPANKNYQFVFLSQKASLTSFNSCLSSKPLRTSEFLNNECHIVHKLCSPIILLLGLKYNFDLSSMVHNKGHACHFVLYLNVAFLLYIFPFSYFLTIKLLIVDLSRLFDNQIYMPQLQLISSVYYEDRTPEYSICISSVKCLELLKKVD